MNNTTNTPVQDAEGTGNRIGFEWGLSNPVLSLLKSVISNNQMVYSIPSDGNLKPSNWNIISINTGITNLGWFGGVLGPDGKVYCAPRDATSILEIDPVTKTTNNWGVFPTGGNKYNNGVLAPNGLIYFAPATANDILEFNPISKVSTSYNITSATSWAGAVLGNDGKMYCIPSSITTPQVLVFDPVSKDISIFTTGLTTYYKGGVLAPNGYIYAIPYSTNKYAKIDTQNKRVTEYTFTTYNGVTGLLYDGGVLAPNGKIYCAPSNADKILVINTLDDSWYYLDYAFNGTVYGSNGKFSGGFLAPDGYVYFANNGQSSLALQFMCKINWVTDEIEIWDVPSSISTGSSSNNYSGGIVTPGGTVVILPCTADYLLFMEFNTPVDLDVCLSSVINKS